MAAKRNLLHSIILLTGLFLFAQLSLLWVNYTAGNVLDVVFASSLTHDLFLHPITTLPIFKFILAHVLIVFFYIGTIWYLSVSIGEMFSLRAASTYSIGIFIWCLSVITIIAANIVYIPNSFFSKWFVNEVFQSQPIRQPMHMIITISVAIFSIIIIFTMINLIKSLRQRMHSLRHGFVLMMLFMLIGMIYKDKQAASPVDHSSKNSKMPNIILIGMDAFRPDYAGYNGNQSVHTPTIDAFLKSSIIFTESYTPLARTFTSWTSLLTSHYPIKNHARDNNTDINQLNLTSTLPKLLKESGYETIYATDDRRFNTVDKRFGFDRVVGPPTGINDFLLGSINDLLLSNLIIATPLGKRLFPFSYANHSAAETYVPTNFQQLLGEALHQRTGKPLFLAVHFTVSGWPFYWQSNQHTAINSEVSPASYRLSVMEMDKQLSIFLHTLDDNKLLSHTLVLLLSDHGITLGLPNDRVIKKEKYQGDARLVRLVQIDKYSDAPAFSLDFKHDYGIDTSYGYGSDALSLKQFHTLLAFRAYGMNLGDPHQVTGRNMLFDIAPTLVDLLHLPTLKNTDGISLLPYLSNASATIKERPLYFETGFRIPDIEQKSINTQKVLEKSIQYYQLDSNTGFLFVRHDSEKTLIREKQFGIVDGDWLLVRYPETQQIKLIPDHSNHLILTKSPLPAYYVLVNLKTGQWTLEMNSPLAKRASFLSLYKKLSQFYGADMPAL